FFKSGVSLNELSGIIGKNVADAAINQLKDSPIQSMSQRPGGAWYRTTSLKGDNLSIGGEWAQALYDRAIPNFLNKYLKRFGVKNENTEIPGVKNPTDYGENNQNDWPGKIKGSSQTVHSIKITPEMKRWLLKEGQPIASDKTYDSQAEAQA